MVADNKSNEIKDSSLLIIVIMSIYEYSALFNFAKSLCPFGKFA